MLTIFEFRPSSMTKLVLLAGLLWTIASCTPLRPPVALSGETLILYETESGPFCGRCDSTKLTVSPDGRVWIEQGHWAGQYRNWTITRRLVKVAPERIAAFNQALEPYRPEGTLALDEKPPCKEFWADLAGVRLSWIENGRTSHLLYNFGCDPASNAVMRAALDAAPAALAIKGLVIPAASGPASTVM